MHLPAPECGDGVHAQKRPAAQGLSQLINPVPGLRVNWTSFDEGILDGLLAAEKFRMPWKFRVCRYLRVKEVFIGDKIAGVALFPLFSRMAFVHRTLLYGTNNVLPPIHSPKPKPTNSLSAAASLCLWLFKAAIVAFCYSLAWPSGKRSYTLLLRFAGGFLIATFIPMPITTLAECPAYPQPRQVTADPNGPLPLELRLPDNDDGMQRGDRDRPPAGRLPRVGRAAQEPDVGGPHGLAGGGV
ncbi:uncharacterized protein B0H64DRAFT_376061 [Chaetomium fimeti]|uniref:Uncharacterized protein n=1 Tax=Chaetomium fimeti TaxID=1854472 RepID=A0AAE0HAT7_9PEZI|nr:hypothetical protein B0H64DRAFT_376061 [Chaetomium fimeti]